MEKVRTAAGAVAGAERHAFNTVPEKPNLTSDPTCRQWKAEDKEMNRGMKWTKECRLGINVIDSQHRLLFAIANELMDFENPKNERPEFSYLFDHLRKYIDEHFQYEENFLKEINYPEYDAHLKKHVVIVQEINGVLKSSQDLSELKKQLDALMLNWIKNHILVEDRKYASWYKQNRI